MGRIVNLQWVYSDFTMQNFANASATRRCRRVLTSIVVRRSAPKAAGVDARGADAKGPDAKGPDARGLDARGPDARGPDAKGAKAAGKGARKGAEEEGRLGKSGRRTSPEVAEEKEVGTFKVFFDSSTFVGCCSI